MADHNYRQLINMNNDSIQDRYGYLGEVKTQANPRLCHACHGKIVTPRSRADTTLAERRAYDLESDKFFPARSDSLPGQQFPTDVSSNAPYVNGRIASGQRNTFILDEIRDCYKHPVRSGETIIIKWELIARGNTRPYNYFITRKGWNPKQVLTREQFDSSPIAVFENSYPPFEDYQRPTFASMVTHHFILPARIGYQLVLVVWGTVDSDFAYYQVIGCHFVG